MRVKLQGESSQFADFLLSIGDRKEEHHKDKGHFFIKLPDDMTVENGKELLDFVFGGIENNYTDSAWLSSRSIICPTNSEVDAINNTIMSIFPGDVKVYRSNNSLKKMKTSTQLSFLTHCAPQECRHTRYS